MKVRTFHPFAVPWTRRSSVSLRRAGERSLKGSAIPTFADRPDKPLAERRATASHGVFCTAAAIHAGDGGGA